MFPRVCPASARPSAGVLAPQSAGKPGTMGRWGSARPRRLRQHRALNSAEFANVAQYLSAPADGMALQPLGAIPRLPPSVGDPGTGPCGPSRPQLRATGTCPRGGAGGGGVQMPPHCSSVNIKHHCLTNEEKPLPSE